jgi:hypothetical protein
MAMSRWMTIEMDDESGFGRESSTLMIGGLCAGATGGLLAMVAGNGQAELLALSFGAIVGLLANLRDPLESRGHLRLVLAIIAGAVMALMLSISTVYAAVAAGLILGAALGLGRLRKDRVRTLVEAGSFGLLLTAGVLTTHILFTRGPLMPLDVPLLRPVLEGSVWGVFLAFAAGIHRLKWNQDPVLESFDAALLEVTNGDREVLNNGRALYLRVIEELDDEEVEPEVIEQARTIATETAEQLVVLARRIDELQRLIRRGLGQNVETRLATVQARLDDATDARVRAELEAMMAELEEQREMSRGIELASARLEARQQRCLTALERLHLALVHSSATSSPGEGLMQALSSLQRLTEEMQWKSLPVEVLLEESSRGGEGEEPLPIGGNGLDENDGDAHLEQSENVCVVEPVSLTSAEESLEDVIECQQGTERPV